MRLSKSTSSLSPCRPRVKGVRAISSSRSFPEASRTIRRGGLVGICFDSAVGDGRRRSIPLAAAEQNLDQSITRANAGDRKSTRLNSSHLVISYAVFCLKKKKRVRGRDDCERLA